MGASRLHHGRDWTALGAGWTCLSVAPDTSPTPDTLPSHGWIAAMVPGTVAGARQLAGLAQVPDLHAQDHWFRREAPLPPGATLEFPGLATLAEIWLDGTLLARSASMFQPLRVTLPAGGRVLLLCFRALRPALSARGAGRPRWRNRLAETEGLRHVRTTLLGHMPGWHAAVPVIGPYRAVRLHTRPHEGPSVVAADMRATLAVGVGRITVRVHGHGLAQAPATLHALGHQAPLLPDGDAVVGQLDIPDPPRWWPHTHGTPSLVPVRVLLGDHDIARGRVGFRSLAVRDANAFGLLVNGTSVFCRGAHWAGIDSVKLPCSREALLPVLKRVRDAGLNMLRVPGFALYESQAFFDLCDELGLLVWHDFMFARFDYPSDDAFLETARAEAIAFLARTGAHPSLAVLCGGHEVAQGAAMAGRPRAAWSSPLFDQVLPSVAASLRPDVPYVAHAPGGGPGPGVTGLPFAASAPVAHYFGVSGYLRPPEDLAAAGVNFAAACLAFANPPRAAQCRRDGTQWQDGAPRDLGASWDFADVRDHYLRTLFGLDALKLRRENPDSWLAHGRAAVALLIEAAFGTWRTDGRCAGALVLGLHDLAPGAGWGLLDHQGQPKSAWHALKRLSSPLQLVLRDHGQNGVALHVLNETAACRTIRLALLGLDPAGVPDMLGEIALAVPPRGQETVPAHRLMGHWRDLGHAWRFGPPSFSVLRATMHDIGQDAEAGTLLGESTLFPAGPALPPSDPALTARLEGRPGGWTLTVHAEKFAQFVTLDDDGYVADDDHFHLWPGQSRSLALTPLAGAVPRGTVSALNGQRLTHYAAAA